MTKRARPDFRAFDEAWAPLTPEERGEAERLLLRYLELVVMIADEAVPARAGAECENSAERGEALTAPLEDRTLALSEHHELGRHYQH